MSFGGPRQLDRPAHLRRGRRPSAPTGAAAAYDEYTSGGWQNTSPDVEVIDGNQPLREPAVSATQAMTVTVYPLEQKQELIFAPPQPQQVSVPVNADIRLVPNPDDESQPLRAVSLLEEPGANRSGDGVPCRFCDQRGLARQRFARTRGHIPRG